MRLRLPGFVLTLLPLAVSASAGAIPEARNLPYPGTLVLAVDATDVTRGIFEIKEIIPVAAAGPLVLLYPKWLPARHADYGRASDIAGLRIMAGGKTLAWQRDPVDVFAIHVDVPAGVSSLDLSFQFLAPTAGNQGRIVTTPDMLNLEWIAMALYPAGYYVDQIKTTASATYPHGWKSATALDIAGTDGDTVHYQTVSFDTLMDSPVFAGANVRVETLAPGVRLNIFADRPDQLAATPEQLQFHRNLVTQALKLFGAQHYDHYELLLALSGQLGDIGREHQRSSENGVSGDYFTDWKSNVTERYLLPHEYTHSWNGKYRRPADLWTPDFRTPMQDSLLWVYEGQTQLWGYVLAVRSGLLSQQEGLDALAGIAASLDTRAGRTWRPLLDTTNDPIIGQRRPKGWVSWQRAEDYYNEGLLVWLDADSLIRELSGGTRSLDDFARAFFGTHDRDWEKPLTYTFDSVVATLDRVQPHDWAKFLHDRIDGINEHAPLDGFTRGGYNLVYTDTPTDWFKAGEKKRKITDLSYSGGLVLGKEGEITGVLWDSPAFNAGLTVGTKIVAVDGRALDLDQLKAAIKAKKSPLSLLVRSGDVFRTVELNYAGGLRYPRLAKLPGATGASRLDALLTARP